MKFFLIFLFIGVALAIMCTEDVHCGAPDIRGKCVNGECEFTAGPPPSRRSVGTHKKLSRGVYSKK